MSFWQHFQKVIDILSGVLNVDTLSSESAASGEIDTSEVSSPCTILMPAPDKRLDTRGVYLYSDSTSGEIEAKFASGSLLAKLYCSKQTMVSLDKVRFTGTVDEVIVMSWTGLSTGAKIYWVVRYKEI
ncbi:MAG: hypothetical protein DRN15_11570 [Thermoprotei archaeon]|nr:MAG: hypothetical protein DRN15_11570 [Thermoprotei archaeon]